MKPVPSVVTKTYPQRGPLQQFRFAESTAFSCFRCGAAKKSKLITIYNADWSNRLCNGCYGRLLSIYEIKVGTSSDDQRAEDLASGLLFAVSLDEQRRAEALLKTFERRAEYLSAEALRLISTAEHVASRLQDDPQLEWSPAVIGLCKAVEVEIVGRILRPLAQLAVAADLSAEKKDGDLGRVAGFCADRTRKPPELGAFAHFLQTSIHSEQRRQSSVLLRTFLRLVADWTGSNWLLDPKGLLSGLKALTTSYRNRAAHIDELSKQDYDGCRKLVLGSEGILWSILLSTNRQK